MILQCQANPQVFQRFAFQEDTRIILQVRGAGTVLIGHDQGEASNPNDGIQLTAAGTATPFDTIWQGEFWYSSPGTPGQPLNLVIIGKVGGKSIKPGGDITGQSAKY